MSTSAKKDGKQFKILIVAVPSTQTEVDSMHLQIVITVELRNQAASYSVPEERLLIHLWAKYSCARHGATFCVQNSHELLGNIILSAIFRCSTCQRTF